MRLGHERYDFVFQEHFVGEIFVLARRIDYCQVDFTSQQCRNYAEIRIKGNLQLAINSRPPELLRQRRQPMIACVALGSDREQSPSRSCENAQPGIGTAHFTDDATRRHYEFLPKG